MATLSHSESRRLYSWWWDSHNSPKNSKWLQENLTDIDAKVKAMIKLIEEDADSFARRAEMYYEKRPELMKLVEEFYRAYRALAERYDHATGELRHAHRTMAAAFPNQIPYELADDSSSGADGEPYTPEMSHPIRSLLDLDDLHGKTAGPSSGSHHLMKGKGGYSEGSESRINIRGLKQLHEMFGTGVAGPKDSEGSTEGSSSLHEIVEGDTGKQAEAEVQNLKKTLAEIKAEKEALHIEYLKSLEKLSSLERELKEVEGLGERASKAEIEVKILKETLVKLEAERDANLLRYSKYLERISSLENMLWQTQEDAKSLNDRAIRAEIEAQNLEQKLSALVAEKEDVRHQYNQCLELISTLENKISVSEASARMLKEQAERAETEVEVLKQALTRLKEEKEAAELRYDQCLERIAKMECEISRAKEDAMRLSSEILAGASKLKSVEEQFLLLESSNQSLQLEAENLTQKIAKKDQELSVKEDELEKLQASLQHEQSRFVEVEAALQTLQKLHSQSQEEQRALALKLQHKFQLLNDLEMCNNDLQEDLQRVKEENSSLNQLNSSSSTSKINLQKEIFSLKEMKDKLEEDLSLQQTRSNSLQQEICHLKGEIEGLNKRYEELIEQVLAAGLDPGSLKSSIRELQDENLKLKWVSKMERDEKENLYERLRDMNQLLEKNLALERSLSELYSKLEGSRERVKELQESCQFLQGEKSGLVAEKSFLLSQFQIMAENMQKLLEKDAMLESSLSRANIELAGLRERSKNLEEFCQMLKTEKFNLQNERSTLVTQLENVEQRLGNLERRFTRLEEKYTGLEKEKETTICEVKELQSYLGLEKKEREHYVQTSESRMADLEKQVLLLKEEGKLSKKEFEEELDKVANAQVEIFILQKFIQDLEEKNLSLLYECKKHVDASKLSNKLISELETENLEQQVEVEFLLDEIDKLRMGIRQVLRAVQCDSDDEHEDGIEEGKIPLLHILDNIEDLKCSVVKNEEEKQQLVVENSVLLTLLGELRLESAELESEKRSLSQEFGMMNEHYSLLLKDKHELEEINKRLGLELRKGERQEDVLRAELEYQHVNLANLQESYVALQEENIKALGENRSLLKKFSDLKEEMLVLEVESADMLQEVVSLSSTSTILKTFGTEKVEELAALSEDLSRLCVINSDLKEKVEILGQKLEAKEVESLHLNQTIGRLQQELQEGKDLTHQLNYQLLIGQDFLREKSAELFEVDQKLKATHNVNGELCRIIEGLKKECEELRIARESIEKQVVELSTDSASQKMEIECLKEANENLKSEVGILCKEVEERRAREEILSLELLEQSNEFQLWEAEASSFYFDLQISSIREVLLENKIQELTAICECLRDENATKDCTVEQMDGRFGFLETEVEQLKAQLFAYAPVIASLKDNIESLEHNALIRTQSFAARNQGDTDVEMAIQPQGRIDQQLTHNETIPDGIVDLIKIQNIVKAVDQAVVTNMDKVMQERSKTNIRPESEDKRAEAELRSSSKREEDIQEEEKELENEPIDHARSNMSKAKISDVKQGISMKDIPLDQVSDASLYGRSKTANDEADNQMRELWESAEQDCDLDPEASIVQKQAAAERKSVGAQSQSRGTKQNSRNRSLELQVEREVEIDKLEVFTSIKKESNQEGNGGKILERLASDTQTLMSLQTTIADLKKKMEAKRGKKANSIEFEEVRRRLKEVENTVAQLVHANGRLTKVAEENPLSLEGDASIGLEDTNDVVRKTLREQARKGSEKIGRLQIELQSIQYTLVKLESEKKSKHKYHFPGSKTGIILKDFIYSSGRKSMKRRKKSRFCGCARPTIREE